MFPLTLTQTFIHRRTGRTYSIRVLRRNVVNPSVLPQGTANREERLWNCGQRKTEEAKATRNGVDRGCVTRQYDPARKRADFRLVFLDEKT